ncbi:MAG: hypothetical protein AAB278_08025, partial [Pseudomonadota bacterium]
ALGASSTAGTGTTLNLADYWATSVFTNDGSITLGGIGYIIGGNWSNTGTLNLNSGSLALSGSHSNTSLATNLSIPHYNRAAGTILNFGGTLTNTGSTLDIGSAGLFGTGGLKGFSGTITGGTLISSDATPMLDIINNGTLDGVTIGSNLSVSGVGTYINIYNNLTLANGVILNTGGNNLLFRTGGVQHIAVQGGLGAATLNDAGGNLFAGLTAGGTLQIDSGVTLQGYGAVYDFNVSALTNNGSIIANTTGQTFSINNSSVTNNGTMSVTAGSMIVSPAALNNGTIKVASGATFSDPNGFTNNGILTGTGTIAVGTGVAGLINQGTISPGGTGVAGTLNITGDLQLTASSILSVDLGGTGAGQSDKLSVTGNITNAGTLNAGLLAGYTPVIADAIPFMTMGGTSSGTFTTTNLPAGFAAGYNLAAGEASRLIFASVGGTITFTNAGNTLDWSNTANWSSGVLPGTLDTALLSTGLAVTHTTGADTIGGLTIGSANSLAISGGSLTVLGLTTLDGTLTVSGGSAALNGLLNGGTSGIVNISVGSLGLDSAATVNSLVMSGGTLNANGTTSLSNLTLAGGTINGHLTTQGTTTVPSGNFTLGAGAIWDNGGTVTITSGGWGYIGTNAILNNSGTFDIGGNFGLQFTGTGGQFNNLAGGTTILSGVYGLPFYNSGVNGTFSNAGALNKTSASTQSFHVINTGTINVSTGMMELTGAWTNAAGTINLSGGVLGLGGNFTTAAIPLGSINRTGGALNLTGVLDNTGSTLDIGSAGIFGAGGLGTLSGKITGGTITGTTLTSASGTLNNVIIGSNLSESGTLFITNGLTLASGVTVNKGNSTWYFDGQSTGQAAGTVHHLATQGSSTVTSTGGALNIYAANGQILQIDSGVTVQGYGTLSHYWAGSIINAGTLISDTAGQTFTISPTNFTNDTTGVVRATLGTTNISAANFTSNAGSLLEVNGGTLTLSPTLWNGASNLNLTAGILNMDTAFSAASLGTYTRTGGTFNIGVSGNLDNTATLLDVNAGLFGAGGLGTLSGKITGGTIT